MLTILGPKQRFCDGISRRNFLKIGTLGLGGLSLPQLLQAESLSGIRRSHKPISTRIPGIQICEHLPLLAGMMDKTAIIRSVVGALDDHDAFQCLTGRPVRNQPPGGWPSLGSVVSKLQGPINRSIPPFVGLSPKMGEMRWARSGDPGFLGLAHAPFKPSGA